MRISALKIYEGEIIPPWYYGLSYQEMFSYHYVFYPIPFNYIVRFLRVLKFKWDKFRTKPDSFSDRVRNYGRREFRFGFEKGAEYGEKRAMKLLSEIIERRRR